MSTKQKFHDFAVKEKQMKREKKLILLMSRYISWLFTPFYLPIMGLTALFIFSYLSILPNFYKIQVLVLAGIFTVLMPTTLIRLYRQHQGWSLLRLISREGRMVPYIISITCYSVCFYLMEYLQFPHFMSSIVVASIVIQILCALINNKWKISTHTAAIGGTTGAVVAFSLIFGFYPLWWLCFLIILAGVVGTGRMLLRLHTLGEITGGYVIGVLAGFFAVVLC